MRLRACVACIVPFPHKRERFAIHAGVRQDFGKRTLNARQARECARAANEKPTLPSRDAHNRLIDA
jgi:hypothetical protein